MMNVSSMSSQNRRSVAHGSKVHYVYLNRFGNSLISFWVNALDATYHFDYVAKVGIIFYLSFD